MARTLIVATALVLGGASMWMDGARAQGGTANWLTDGGDVRRTAWQRDEEILTTSNAKDIRLLWKLQLDNQPRQMHSLFPPLIVGRVTTANGPKEIAVVAGVSDNLYGIDVAAGTIIWKRHFESELSDAIRQSTGGTLCPGGLTATPVIAPTDTPGRFIIYAVSWDGRLRQVDVATGEEIAPPELFMPPNGKPYGLNLYNGVIWTTTAQGCGGNPNTVYAFDLATKKVGTFQPGSGGMWPRSGPSLTKDGMLIAGTGDGDYYPESRIYGMTIVGVKQNPETKALYLADWYTPSNAIWLRKRDLDMNVTGPVFDYQGKEYVVQSSKECRIWLLDTAALGGDDHRTPVYRTPLYCNEEVNFAAAGVWGALATWVDNAGTRWVLSPFWGPKHPDFHAPIEHGQVVHGAVVAFKMENGPSGTPVLNPAWISRDMNMADPPVVANGIVFGFGSGEDTSQRGPDPSFVQGTVGRISRSTNAVLYALDGQTGRELWSSGDQITSWNHFSGLSVANGRVYIGTYDGVLYSFGIQR
jgi:outer membrane protein assembly factor BamB